MGWNISKIFTFPTLLAISLLQGCAGPARYDVAKFGTVQQVGILDFSESELSFWAEIERGGNPSFTAGVNNSKAARFSRLLSGHHKEIYAGMHDALKSTLKRYSIEATTIPAPLGPPGLAENQYSSRYASIKVPLLLKCKMQLGFVQTQEGIIPSTTITYKILASKEANSPTREVRLDRSLSIGYGRYFSVNTPQVIGLPKKLYPDEKYILDHPDEVAADLITIASELGNAAALSIHQSTQ